MELGPFHISTTIDAGTLGLLGAFLIGSLRIWRAQMQRNDRIDAVLFGVVSPNGDLLKPGLVQDVEVIKKDCPLLHGTADRHHSQFT